MFHAVDMQLTRNNEETCFSERMLRSVTAETEGGISIPDEYLLDDDMSVVLRGAHVRDCDDTYDAVHHLRVPGPLPTLNMARRKDRRMQCTKFDTEKPMTGPGLYMKMLTSFIHGLKDKSSMIGCCYQQHAQEEPILSPKWNFDMIDGKEEHVPEYGAKRFSTSTLRSYLHFNHEGQKHETVNTASI